MTRFFILLVSLIILLVVGIHFYIPKHEINLASQVWRHKGGDPENNIKGIKASIAEGFRGVEIDVHFINNKILLGHSKEQAQKDHLDLTQVFRDLENLNVQLWLDFKESNPKNSFKFAFYLRKILKNTSSSIPLFVETKDPITLTALSLARIPTSFGFEPRKNVPNGVYKNLYKVFSWYFKPVFLSSTPINHSQINTLLPKKEKVIFTLNDTEMIKSYCRTPKIKIILTDLPFERIQTACN